MAIICKEAAKSYMENVEGFEVISECVRNSDIFVMKKDNPKKIGMTQERNYQKDLIKKRFGEDVEIVPMMVGALPYALENGEVDAIIIDFVKGIHLKGKKEDTVVDGDYTTYVLLARTEFKKTREFKKFVKIYNQSLEELMKDQKLLKNHFYDYAKTDLEEGGLEKWKIKLLPIIVE
jgi:hypothetical protein